MQTIETLVVPRAVDLGDGFIVRRAVPSAQRRMVGPFVFFDQMGPATLEPGTGMDVRPHPHIGLATVTYLFDGEILHRDSLGTVQPIRPAELNWMTAGRGIVHSERTPPQLRAAGSRAFGIQAWVALPRAHEETEPQFVHYDDSQLPVLDEDGSRIRLLVGELLGARAPVRTLSPMLYADVTLQPGAQLALPPLFDELAFHVVEGQVQADGRDVSSGELAVLARGAHATVRAAAQPARLMLFGGEPLDGPRRLWWNFVASSKERIDRAAADWEAGRFPPVPGETEFIPLPKRPQGPVAYP
ncbi:MAG TPA: pirin family protein [Burkholderiaceae bacterium]|nr:pirin family protein [Burkholderiaceae bacterium]